MMHDPPEEPAIAALASLLNIASPVPRLALNKAEAARALGVSERQIEDMVASGQVPNVRIGRRVLLPVDGLRIWLANQLAAGMAKGEADGEPPDQSGVG